MVLKIDNTFWAWGRNWAGQLGLGDTQDRWVPTQVGTGTNWSIISVGGYYSLAIKNDGTLWLSGTNPRKVVAVDDATSVIHFPSPTQVGTGTNWANVSAGPFHSLTVKTDGTLWAWGDNWSGELGLGNRGDDMQILVPTQVGSDTDWKTVSATISTGNAYSLAIKTNGTLWAWGDNFSGDLGLGDTRWRLIPTQVGTDTNWKTISTGQDHSLAIKTDGTLWVCGWNGYGQLGLGDMGDNTERLVFTQVGTATDWTSVDGGYLFTIAIKTDGTLWSWGGNDYGELGLGDTQGRLVPTQVGADTNWKSIVCGEYHTIALKTDGTLWGWGNNWEGELGLGDTQHRLVPTQIGTDTNWKLLAE